MLITANLRKAAIGAVRQLSADAGIPTKLVAMKEEALGWPARSAAADTCAPGNPKPAAADACAPGNPKPAAVEDFKALFRKIV